MALAIDGRGEADDAGDDAACDETVRKYWNAFTGAWRRKYDAIPHDIAASITQVRNYSSHHRVRNSFGTVYQRPSCRRLRPGQVEATEEVCHQKSLVQLRKTALDGRLV